MNSYINLNATRGEDFVITSSEVLIEQGVPKEAVFSVMDGMAEGLEEQGYTVEMEICYPCVK